MSVVLIETRGPVRIITINRPEKRNAVDGETAHALYDAFKAFDADADAKVAVFTGADGNFCAGADLKAVSQGKGNPIKATGDFGPMGPSRLLLSKPVIAAVEGYAVAGGIELAIWADLRVASETARFGVFCRRFGVPLVDGGTIRLPRLIGQSRALDMILTGREVDAAEALEIGLANRRVPAGEALSAAIALAEDIAAFPERCMRSDRLSAHEQWGRDLPAALEDETRRGLAVIHSGETRSGATEFAKGKGRHGQF